MAAGEGATRYKVYTKTGDQGTSSLYTGERRPKDDLVFQALGDVDELNSALGIAREHAGATSPELAEQLATVQSRLLDVGSAVATPAASASDRKQARVQFPADATQQLEAWVDAMDERLPPLTQFILPSGGLAASALHLARSICRRAERSAVHLARAGLEEDAPTAVLIYLNRLSDYLFTAARAAAKDAGREEVTYCKA